jgi:hypothetical protein
MDVLKLTNVPGFDFTHAGTDGDRGCVRCKAQALPNMPGLVIMDDRGRYWHARCASITLAEFTRFEETRGESFHYERSFVVGGPEPELVGAARRIKALEKQISDLQGMLNTYRETFHSRDQHEAAVPRELQGYCPGNCSRGGDGPPCGKIGCEG